MRLLLVFLGAVAAMLSLGWLGSTSTPGSPPPSRHALQGKPTKPATSSLPSQYWTVKGSPFSTEELALTDAIEKARDRVKTALQQQGPPLAWEPTDDFVRTHLIRGRKTDEIRPNDPQLDSVMYAVTLEVELTPDAQCEILKYDRSARAFQRLEGLGRVLAVLVASLAALAAYIRLDDWSRGYLTGTLRVAAVAVVAVAALVALKTL